MVELNRYFALTDHTIYYYVQKKERLSSLHLANTNTSVHVYIYSVTIILIILKQCCTVELIVCMIIKLRGKQLFYNFVSKNCSKSNLI